VHGGIDDAHGDPVNESDKNHALHCRAKIAKAKTTGPSAGGLYDRWMDALPHHGRNSGGYMAIMACTLH
jgi:hypothetical protein